MEIGGASTLVACSNGTQNSQIWWHVRHVHSIYKWLLVDQLIYFWNKEFLNDNVFNYCSICGCIVHTYIYFYYFSYVCFYINHQEQNFPKNISGFPVHPSILSGAGKADHQSRWRKVTWMESQVLVLP